ncbi:MAG: putative nucleotidyltransferase [Sphingobacteriales bacterium]|jgi:predicted nucleotidyltransferase
MIKLVEENIEKLRNICKTGSVAELYLFGSAVSGNFSDTSDLDFAGLFKEGLTPIEHGDSFFSLMFNLKELFDREIDLVSYRVVKNPIFKAELDNTKISLYAA